MTNCERPVPRLLGWTMGLLLVACSAGACEVVVNGERAESADEGPGALSAITPQGPGCGDGVCALFADPVSSPDIIYSQLVALIDATPAGEVIRGSMYTFARVEVADALVAAKERGVQVRISVDQYGSNGSPSCADSAGGFASCPNFDNSPTTACGKLRDGLGTNCDQGSCYVRCGTGSPGQACISPAANGINHEKYFLFSRTSSAGSELKDVVFVTSSNLLETSKKWQNAVVSFGDAEWFAAWRKHSDAQLAEDKNADYNEFFSNPRYTARWSPRAQGDHWVAILKNVTQASPDCAVSVNMADFSDANRSFEVASELTRIQQLGCPVTVIGNPNDRDFSVDIRDMLIGSGAEVRIASPKTHDKFMLIHARYNGSPGVRSMVWTGSHNITGPALVSNDENLVKVEDPAVFAAFEENYRLVRDHYSSSYPDGAPPSPSPSGDAPSTTPPPAPGSCGVLSAGEALAVEQSLTSCDGRFRLVLQSDGNLVLYQDALALWSSETSGTSGQVATMQSDGNFVLYDAASTPLFHTGTSGHNGAYLAMQDDGNLVVYGPGNLPLWDSQTSGH